MRPVGLTFQQPRYDPEAAHRNRCLDCDGQHQIGKRCRVLCRYCHSFHLRTELIDSLCPLMHPLASKEQERHAYQCKNCRGQGSYVETVITTREETESKYQYKLQKWKQKTQDKDEEQEEPQKTIIFQSTRKEEIVCSDCKGKGLIMRIVECCSQGCFKCKGNKNMINPRWQEYRKEPVLNTDPFPCPICLQNVEEQEYKYVLSCKHEFHRGCIFRWLKGHRPCPVCRQRDYYVQTVDFQIPEMGDMPVQIQSHGPIQIYHSDLDSWNLQEND